MAQTGRSLLPLTGVVFFVLFLIGFLIAGDTLSADATGDEVATFYTENESKQMFSAILGAVATVFFLFFVGAVWSVLRSAEGMGGPLSAVAIAGGAVAAAGMLMFSGFTFVLASEVESFDPGAAQALNALNANFFFPLAGGLATFLFATGLVALRTAALPSWLAWLALLIAVVTFTPLGFFAFLASILWILLTSLVLWTRQAAPAGVT